MAMVAAIQFLNELFESCVQTVELFSDNKGAIELAKNNTYSARSKHIDIKHKFVHEKLNCGDIIVNYLETDNMPADISTKSCSRITKALSNIWIE